VRVLITGGAKELGRAFSEVLGAQGHQLVLTGRDEKALEAAEAELKAKNIDVETHKADLADPHATPKLIESLGSLDVLVNNGADGGPVGPTWQVDETDWWRTFEVNLRGTATAMNAAIRTMTSGRIINVVSNAGAHRWPYVTAYAVSKAAVIKLTENVAVELKRRPIAVLSYDPGMVDVGLMSRGCDGSSANPDEQRIGAWARSQRAQGRFTPVEQSAALLARIVSGEFDHRSGGLLTPADG
jgi:NAD(P)-dependent dehydrogenase (short-subunit alcohol dehydrogenase family)